MSSREPFPAICVRCPQAVLRALDGYCERTGQRRSVAVRDAVVALLREAGCWPPSENETRAPKRGTASRKGKRPLPFVIGPVHARVIRGPDSDGSWYWQAVVYRDAGERTVWTGWATHADAEREVEATAINLWIDARNQEAGRKLISKT